MPQLFETQQDIKPFVSGTNINNDIKTLEGYLDTAAEEYMIPVLGREYYSDFVSKYNTNDLSTAQEAALKYLQAPLAHFAYYLMACDGGLSIDDSGITTTESGNAKRPYQWQARDFKKNRLKHGWIAMQAMIKYLHTNKADHTTYWDSAERKDLYALVVYDIERWRRYDGIDGMGTWWKLRNYIRETVENELKSNLGEDFYTAYNTWLLAAQSPESEDNTALLPYIERVIINGTLEKACYTLPITLNANGIYIEEIDRGLQNDETQKKAPESDILRMQNHANLKLSSAIAMLKKYLDTNASADKYQEYYSSDLYNSAADSHTPPEGLFTGPTVML